MATQASEGAGEVQTTPASQLAGRGEVQAASHPEWTGNGEVQNALGPQSTGDVAEPGAVRWWPELSAEHPLRQFHDKLPSILEEAAHSEIWGIVLSTSTTTSSEKSIPFTTALILQKFLRANENDVDKAAAQLTGTLRWRREFDVRKAVEEEVFDHDTFAGLGYVTVVDRQSEDEEGEGQEQGKEVVTWNIYGAVQDKKRTFGDLERFLRWRVALMEKSLSHLSLASARAGPIPDYNTGGADADPYQMTQVHDYLSVSFLRMDPAVKAASQRTIALFQAHYPELLSRKFFVNVPTVMGWLFSLMKTFMAKETARKLTVLSEGRYLVGELGEGVPEVYGGKGKALEEVGETVRLAKREEEEEEEEGKDEDATEGG
ncbi:MAG: Non-classical phosphatidylinositol transfer protein (PITP) [Sclerophora amabilis]|nr:MAG: Non-classical phosphatidylinositol transfer protein (PITP) [Sclerophora amabilis]